MAPLWFCAIAACALFGGLAWYLGPLASDVLTLQLAFSPRVFAQVVHAWTPEMLARYRQHLVWDFALLLSYGAFGYLLALRTRLFAPLGPSLGRLATWWLPLAAVCDACEDLLQLVGFAALSAVALARARA